MPLKYFGIIRVSSQGLANNPLVRDVSVTDNKMTLALVEPK